MPFEVEYKKLRNECDPEIFKFNDTSELKPLDGIIGQKRAVEAIEFGLKVRMSGYNIYMSGITGSGKTSYAQSYIKKVAAKDKTPDDWCYIYNFDDPNQPLSVNLPAGMGRKFQKDMDNFIKEVGSEIARVFDSKDYEKEKAEIVKDYQEKRNELLEKLNEEVEKQGFKVKTNATGVYFLPIIDGKTLSMQEYADLDDSVKYEINKKSDEVQRQTVEIIHKIREIEKWAENKISEWENAIALQVVESLIIELKTRYRDYGKILNYLDNVQKDILENLDEFRNTEKTQQEMTILTYLSRRSGFKADRYKINLFVDNSKLKGAPVIVDFNPTFYNLVGKIEYENELGVITTDFTKIKPGNLHLANGGYLILQAKDVLTNYQSWELLKRVLKTKKIEVENIKELLGIVAVSTLKPEPISVNVKVILIGSELIYQLLYEYDEDFRKLFKIKADFDYEMERNKTNIMKLARFISGFCTREDVRHFDRTGVAGVVEYSSRLVEDQKKMTTRFNDIVEILCEASTWAELDNSSLVRIEHVKKAIAEKEKRSNRYDEKLLELMRDDTIMIDTQGEVIGQINGLSIIDTGDYAFGKPSRITATTYMGKSGIINIEREVNMSGRSHSKGVLILSGYIGQKYAQRIPLSLSASLCFEQLYGSVDGDSASSAELYALLSSLAEVPIKQGMAVTGSVNQRGEIQPIGGATQKIEGFFELCKIRGLTGEQGVIIPYSNIRNLMLKDEVVEAVKEGKFHIYPIKTIDEGIEILTGMKAGKQKKDGSYPKGTINGLVYEKLKRFAEQAKRGETKRKSGANRKKKSETQ
ncbi:MAG TPA: AAA family ATPase [Clostridiaceae bacterium]|jgi:lon-related putative ATP-dependent protease|nr:AAA family ATPase [Clostridiaceae bacterium]